MKKLFPNQLDIEQQDDDEEEPAASPPSQADLSI